MLSYIFLADGPCDEHSWRPNDDKSQWWSRRDALVRIAGAALWRSTGTHNSVVNDACFLFENQSFSKKTTLPFCRPLIIMNSAQTVKNHATPTERELIQLWRNEFSRASTQGTLSQSLTVDSCLCSTICSMYVWKELSSLDLSVSDTSYLAELGKRELLKLIQSSCPMEFLRKHNLNCPEALILKKRNKETILAAYNDWLNNNKNISANREEICRSVEPDSTANTESYKKLLATFKVLLKALSKRSSIPTEHTTLLLLHEDYKTELPVFGDSEIKISNSVETTKISNNKDYISNASASLVICAMGAVRDATDEEVTALVEAARFLNMRCVGANLGRTAEFTSKIVTALNAHTAAGKLISAVAALPEIKPKLTNNSIGKSSSLLPEKLEPHRMGAWSWNGYRNNNNFNHSKNMRNDSIDSNKERNIGSHTTTTTTKKRMRSDGDYFSESTMMMMMADTNEKDESGNKRVSNNTTNSISTIHNSSSSGGSGDNILQHMVSVVAWLPLVSSADLLRAIDDNEKQQHHHRASLHGLIQLIVTTLWRSRLASEASSSSAIPAGKEKAVSAIDGENNIIANADSSSKFSNIQNIVDASEGETVGNDIFQHTTGSSSAKVIPVLFLVFQDGSMVTLTQVKLALAMANQHMAAPSEYQILHMLQQIILQQQSQNSPCSSTIISNSSRSVLDRVLGQIEQQLLLSFQQQQQVECDVKKHKKALKKMKQQKVRVVELLDTNSVYTNSKEISLQQQYNMNNIDNNIAVAAMSQSSIGGTKTCVDDDDLLVNGSILSDYAYSQPCSCGAHSGNNNSGGNIDNNIVHVVILLRDRNLNNNSNSYSFSCGVQQALYQWVRKQKHTDDKKQRQLHSHDTALDIGCVDTNKQQQLLQINEINRKISNMYISARVLPIPFTSKGRITKITTTDQLYNSYSDNSRHINQQCISSCNISPAVAVTTLQHWAYHDRLYSTINEAISKKKTIQPIDNNIIYI